jgi:transcriptional regulator with XRE-family HTH domain
MRGTHLVREARKRAGLTQAEVAARVGTTQSAVARIESGRVSPSLERLTALVRACGLDIDVRLVPYDDHDVSIAFQNLELAPGERVTRMMSAYHFSTAAHEAMQAAERVR